MTRTSSTARALVFSLLLTTVGLAGTPILRAQEKEPDEPAIEVQVTRLLAQLKRQQDQRIAGQDAWAETMKALIELGPAAVPALNRALLDTPVEERRMLRSLPFILRGIGDKRAVPVLIMTLPKCYGSDGSDMGYNTKAPELLAFMRKHDDDLNDRDPTGYNWGRPINEVRTALNKLTGTQHGEIELCHIHGQKGTARQHYLKRLLFIRCAERWAAWWDEQGPKQVGDAFVKVRLPELDDGPQQFPLVRDLPLTVTSRMSNMKCEPLFDKKSRRVFYDIDTGRNGGVHPRWQGKADAENQAIIAKWAASEGFDIMGTQIEVEGKTVFVLRLLGGKAWELPFEHWQKYQPVSAETLIEQGREVQDLLVVQDAAGKQLDYRGTGLFLIITADETPALLRLGVEVHDTSLRTGVALAGDSELNPIGFSKGRRFGIRLLEAEGKE